VASQFSRLTSVPLHRKWPNASTHEPAVSNDWTRLGEMSSINYHDQRVPLLEGFEPLALGWRVTNHWAISGLVYICNDPIDVKSEYVCIYLGLVMIKETVIRARGTRRKADYIDNVHALLLNSII